MDGRKVTIYSRGIFGITADETILVGYGTVPYAQYKAVPYVDHKPPRKRSVRRRQADGYMPYMLVVEGWNQPEPPSTYDESQNETRTYAEGSVTIKHSRYSSCDPRMETDFDEIIDKADVKIIADFRHTKGFSSQGWKSPEAVTV